MRALAAATVLGVLTLLLGVPAYTATNTVAGGKVGQTSLPITADSLKPPDCSGITLTTLVIGTTGTSGNDLLIGTSGIDAMSGGAGNDCILGGGGADTIDGGTGTDVCVGGPGLDVFLPTCETQVQ
jgi:Ca2+-binding RTX toxin-like protein